MRDFDQLIAELARDPPGVKPASHPYMLSLKLIGVAGLYLAALLGVSGARPDWTQAVTQPLFVAEIVLLVLVFMTATLSATLLSFPDGFQRRSTIFAPAWVFALFLVVIALAWQADSPPAALPKHDIECTICIVLLAILPALWTLYGMRKLATTQVHWAGGIAMLSAFSVGALWLRLEEANDSMMHVVEWHYLPMLAFGLVGLWLGGRLLKW